MTKQSNYNAGIYVRLSQEDERAGESLSIEDQNILLVALCQVFYYQYHISA